MRAMEIAEGVRYTNYLARRGGKCCLVDLPAARIEASGGILPREGYRKKIS